jgi:hypothetical protein
MCHVYVHVYVHVHVYVYVYVHMYVYVYRPVQDILRAQMKPSQHGVHAFMYSHTQQLAETKSGLDGACPNVWHTTVNRFKNSISAYTNTPIYKHGHLRKEVQGRTPSSVVRPPGV